MSIISTLFFLEELEEIVTFSERDFLKSNVTIFLNLNSRIHVWMFYFVRLVLGITISRVQSLILVNQISKFCINFLSFYHFKFINSMNFELLIFFIFWILTSQVYYQVWLQVILNIYTPSPLFVTFDWRCIIKNRISH